MVILWVMYCMIGCLLLSVQNKGLICFETRIRFASKQGFVLFPTRISLLLKRIHFASKQVFVFHFKTRIRFTSKQWFGPFRNNDSVRFETRIRSVSKQGSASLRNKDLFRCKAKQNMLCPNGNKYDAKKKYLTRKK